MTDRGPGILTEIIVTEQDINDIISCLDPQKASGPDDISHRMLIATKNTICRPLCKLFNLSLWKKCFPSFWKLANVIAVFKKSDKSIASNYIPISLLSCVSKILRELSLNMFLTILVAISIYINYSLAFSLDIPLHITQTVYVDFLQTIHLLDINNDLQNLHDMVNSDLSNIKKWSKDWLITFNPDKTDIMLFDNRRQGNLSFKFGQTDILSVDFHKHRGIVVFFWR